MRGHEFIGQGVEKGTFNEVFGGEQSLVESLQVTSGSLLPPFKTVRVVKNNSEDAELPFLDEQQQYDCSGIKPATKPTTYTQTQTIIVNKELKQRQQQSGDHPKDCGIREIISQRGQEAQLMCSADRPQRVASSSELRAFEVLAAPFARRTPTKKAESSVLPISFVDEISKVKPRESLANRQAISSHHESSHKASANSSHSDSPSNKCSSSQ